MGSKEVERGGLEIISTFEIYPQFGGMISNVFLILLLTTCPLSLPNSAKTSSIARESIVTIERIISANSEPIPGRQHTAATFFAAGGVGLIFTLLRYGIYVRH